MKRQINKQMPSKHINDPEFTDETRRLVITGATGFLGRHLLAQLLDDSGYSISIITLDKEKPQRIFPNQKLEIYDYSDVRHEQIHFGDFDCLIHIGFTKEKNAYHKIAESLETTNTLFNLAMLHQIPAIINISSLNVYGLDKPPFWKETDRLFPQLPYGMAKLATELILNGVMLKEKRVKGTSLRLSALSGGSILLNEIELSCRLVDQVLDDRQIVIYGGQQRFERLDVHDAARAIIRLINTPSAEWKPVYNLGVNENYSLLEIAEKVIKISNELNLGYSHKLIIEKNEDPTAFGMDSSLFMTQMNWMPIVGIDDMIRSVFRKKLEQR